MHTSDNSDPKPEVSILFLGDCNTRGTPDIEQQAYPALIGHLAGVNSINCGHTMTTCREGSRYYQAHADKHIDVLCIQYGLVDSWLTFRYAPYVLYYPDNPARKFARKLVKKYKKVCKKWGLNRKIGEVNVVPATEYKERICRMIRATAPRPVVLIETIPNKEQSRNPEIRRYNRVLCDLAAEHDNAYLLPLYEDFSGDMRQHYSDPTHLSGTGHAYVADKLKQLFVRHSLIKSLST